MNGFWLQGSTSDTNIRSVFADVFWYKEEANGIQQLDESDRVEISVENGQHFIDIYNTTQDDKGDKFSG